MSGVDANKASNASKSISKKFSEIAAGEIKQIIMVSDSLRYDCYSIVSQFHSIQANQIYNQIRIDVNKKHHTLFVFESNGFVRGFIKANTMYGLGVSILDWLYVDSRYMRNSIGEKLLSAYIEQARQNNIEKIYLNSSPMAVQFYKKNGFKIIASKFSMEKSLR